MVYYICIYLIALSGLVLGANKSPSSKKKYLFCVFGLLFVIAALRSTNVGTDLRLYYSYYYPRFASAKWSEIQNVTASGHWEWGFCALCKISAMINPDSQFFIVISSALSIIPYAIFIYRNSDDVVFPTVFYIGMHVYTMFLSGLRQAIATGIILLALEKLKKKQYIRFLIYVLISTAIHTSAIIVLALLILERITFSKNVVTILIGLTGAFAFGYQHIILAFMKLQFFNDEYSIYEIGYDHAAGFITGHTLGLFVITVLVLIASIFGFWDNREEVKANNDSLYFSGGYIYLPKKSGELTQWSNSCLIYASYLAVLFRFGAFFVNVLARFAYYFMPMMMISYPKMRSNIETGTSISRNTWDLIIYSGITAFFLYICIFRLQSLWGVSPYEFFWNV